MTSDSILPILVVDDDPDLLSTIAEQLVLLGDYQVKTFPEPSELLNWLQHNPARLVISDIHMPQMNGMELIGHIKQIDTFIQVILITGYPDNAYMRTAIKAGVFDFLRKPFAFAELIVSVKQALEKNELLHQNAQNHKLLEQRVHQRTQQLMQANHKLESHYINTLRAMVNAIEAKDPYTKGHSERVTALSMMIGKYMGLDEEQLKILRLGSMLHDLGKLGIYNSLLNKPSDLSKEELDLIHSHPELGAKIIEPIDLPEDVLMMILQHHEWHNGAGYPKGISDAQISPFAKIIAVADAFDAMTSHRFYRTPSSFAEAATEIKNKSGIQFDPHVVKIFNDNLQEITFLLNENDNISEYVFGNIASF